MFKVIAYSDHTKTDPVIIHEPQKYGNKILTGAVEDELNAVSMFDFSLAMNNSYYRKFKELRTYISVIDEMTKEVIFEGRVIKNGVKMTSSGHVGQTITAEDKLAFLHDTTQEYMKTSLMNLRDYLHRIINTHNKQCEPHKRFTLRNVTVSTSSEKVFRSIGYAKTSETIKDKLLDRLGGYLVFEEVNDKLYLDYLKDYGEISDTPIQLAKNLKEATKETVPDGLATVIVPLGSEVDSKDSQEANQDHDFSKERITIKTVNNGNLELVDKELVKQFGRIRQELIMPDAKNPTYIKNQGLAYFKNQRIMLITWGVTVIELGLLDKRYDLFKTGNYHYIYNDLISPEERLQIISKKTNIVNPHKTELKVGNQKRTLSQYQNQLKSQDKKNRLARERVNESLTRVYEMTETSNQQSEIIDVLVLETGETKNELTLTNSKIEEVESQTRKSFEETNQKVVYTNDELTRINGTLTQELQDLGKRVLELEKGDK
ncbi:MAG: phage tail protein [Vagococcus salmoninarum]|uniref:phage tail protein n=1 Tax=Vagococcus salmoninarum TaxID=2739 RepID=UPI003F9BAC55